LMLLNHAVGTAAGEQSGTDALEVFPRPRSIHSFVEEKDHDNCRTTRDRDDARRAAARIAEAFGVPTSVTVH